MYRPLAQMKKMLAITTFNYIMLIANSNLMNINYEKFALSVNATFQCKIMQLT